MDLASAAVPPTTVNANPPPYDPLSSVSNHPATSSAAAATSSSVTHGPSFSSTSAPPHVQGANGAGSASQTQPAMDTPTETPHDLYCKARDYERHGRAHDASNLYLKASMNGHLSAMVAYATHLVSTDERAAFVWFRAAAERGDARAWYELGQLLARGRYFEVNAIDAARCWKRAAQMGDNTGKSALGLCYIRGFGVKQDPEKGVEIVKQVADVHNDVTAMKNLAWIYRHGKGVHKDMAAAEYWDDRAKKQDDIMRHIASREQVLFGRGRLRSGRQKGRDGEKGNVRPDIRDNSTSDRPPTPDPDPRFGKERDSFKAGMALQVDELEGRLRNNPDESRGKAHLRAAPIDDNPGREPSFSPNPVRGSHLPDNIEGDTLTGGGNTTPGPMRNMGYEIRNGQSNIVKNMDMHPRNINNKHNVQPPHDDHTVSGRQQQPDHTFAQATVPFIRQDDPGSSTAEYNEKSSGIGTTLPSEHVDDARKIPNRADANLPSVAAFAAAAAATATLAGERGSGERSEERFESPEEGFEDVEQEVKAKRTLAGSEILINKENGDPESNYATVGSSDALANQNAQPKDALVVEPPYNIGPVVSSHRKVFEAQLDVNKDSTHSSTPAPQPSQQQLQQQQLQQQQQQQQPRVATPEPAPAPAPAPGPFTQSGGTAVSNIGTTATHIRKDVDSFQDAEHNFEAGPSNADGFAGGEELVNHNQFSARDDGGSIHTQNTDMFLQNVSYGNIGNTEAPIDAGALETLEQVLVNYPRNPMRADSLHPLKVMVKIIQGVPVASAEAYGVIDRNFGLFKVIVAMISQHEDEHIQEHGLHCLLRILRATSSSNKEGVILTSYAECFKNVQGNADVIVPKGTVRVNEDLSGAVQAIVNAMRHHATVRRIQLAGCAALSEIASTSSDCRSAALEQGAVNLLLACLRHRSSPSAAVIHEMAGRAISSFCNGKENAICKEAFTNAGVVPEFLSVLQLWGHSEEATSDLMTNATLCCCGGLRHVTDGYSRAAVQCVQSFAYHHLIRIMVLRRDDVDICRVVLAALTAITRNAGPAAEKPLNDAKPLPEVLATMQVHPESPLFIRKALDFMEALGSYPVMREEIVVAGGIQFAADIIEQDANDTILLERACGVVEKLCRGSAPNQEIFASRKGMKSLTTLLNSYSRQPGVVERALCAMSSVSTNNAASQREAQLASAPEELVRVLKFYSSKNSKVVAACAGAISALVVPKNTSMAQAFARLEAPELVVRAMKRHPDSVMVQENGSAAVAAFCEADPQIMSLLLKSNITNILVVGLQRFLHKQTAVVQIVRAMRAITNEVIPDDSYRFKSKLLTDRSNESSLPEIFHTALSYHKRALPETANVIISICATINRLCMRSVAFKNEVGKDGIVEELKRLVERTAEFKELGALQPVLATICTLVLESEENKNRFHSVGGVEAILDVMQKWNHDTYVLEHCCAALRYSCNDHFGNCTEVKNHNGVRSILGVMEMHPENVNVTLWCCLTLADLCKGDEELQSSATVVQGIRKVVSAMNMFSTNSRFLSSACEFLRAASACNVDNQERIVRLGGRTAIVKALENHPTDSTLTESAAYALLQIQEIPDPRTSVDSAPQVGLVKRLSRDLRRSGSSSNRSNRSNKGKFGRKSLSFTSRRRTEEVSDQQHADGYGGSHQGEEHAHGGRPLDDDDDIADEEEMANRNNMRRTGKTSSFINFQKLIRRRSRTDRSSEHREAEMRHQQQQEEQRDDGDDDGYGDYDDNYEGPHR